MDRLSSAALVGIVVFLIFRSTTIGIVAFLLAYANLSNAEG